jgi:hypothetical protein
MPEDSGHEQREHEITMHVFTLSAGVVGVCLTGIGLLRLFTSNSRVNTVADDLLAADPVAFMSCCFLSFWSFKTSGARRRRTRRIIIDALFMVALAFMVAICALIAYAIA